VDNIPGNVTNRKSSRLKWDYIELATRQELLSNEEVPVVRQVRELRNRAAHSLDPGITITDALRYHDVANSMIEKIKRRNQDRKSPPPMWTAQLSYPFSTSRSQKSALSFWYLFLISFTPPWQRQGSGHGFPDQTNRPWGPPLLSCPDLVRPAHRRLVNIQDQRGKTCHFTQKAHIAFGSLPRCRSVLKS